MKNKTALFILTILSCTWLLCACGKKVEDVPAPDVEEVTVLEEETSEEPAEEVPEVVQPSKGNMLEIVEYQEFTADKLEYPAPPATVIYEATLEFLELKDPEKYEKLSASLEEEYQNCLKERQEEMDSFIEYATESDLDPATYEYFTLPFPIDAGIMVFRHDTTIFNFEECHYQFTGGAHPFSWVDTRNYDPKTGERLTLRDVAVDYDELYEEVYTRVVNYDAAEFYFDTFEEKVHSSFYESDPDWLLTDDGLYIDYDTYELGPYVMGPVTIFIPYTQCAGLIKDEYILTEKQAMALYDADWSVVGNEVAEIGTDGEPDGDLDGYPGFPAEGTPEPEYVTDVVMPGYDTVNYRNLQGTWLHKYTEDGSDFVEMLVVNGKHGKLMTTKDGKLTSYWNAEGEFTLTDRSSAGKSPKATVLSPDGDGGTIYIRSVNVEEALFEDAGFNFNWERALPEDENDFLADTVTLDNLVGTWYCREEVGGDEYLYILAIGENGHASYREVLEGYEVPIVDMPYADLYIVEDGNTYPTLEIQGPDQEIRIGISCVDDTSFFSYDRKVWFTKGN